MIGYLNIVEINVKFLNGFIHVFVKCVGLPCDAWKLPQTDRQLSPTSPGSVLYLHVKAMTHDATNLMRFVSWN